MVRAWSLKPGELVQDSFNNFKLNAISVEEKEKKRLQHAISAEEQMSNKLQMKFMFILKKGHQMAMKKDLEMQLMYMLIKKLETLFLNFNNWSMIGSKESEMIYKHL